MPRDHLRRAAVGLLLLAARPASAYETDQLTHRVTDLPDIVVEANVRMDILLERAMEATNRRTGCKLGLEATRVELARQIRRQGGGFGVVPERGPVRMWGFSRFSAWVESSGVGLNGFIERDDIFSTITLRDSAILKLAGPSGTVRIAGQLVGTDKFDHFFELGYDYYLRSDWGLDPDSAIAWGTATERTYFGTLTSRTFSFADLRSNLDGYWFYATLLEPGSVVALDAAGCAVQARPFDWADYVTWEWDEVLNPSVYVPAVQAAVREVLEQNRETVCAEYARWGGEAYSEHLARVLSSWPPYALGPAPARSDPFQLQRLCTGDPIYKEKLEIPWSLVKEPDAGG